MSRYRPPQPKSSPYITQSGFDKLQSEQKALWQRRKEVTAAVTAAAAEGDRSENAEYIYRKKELREIDRRIRYLQKRLPDLTIVERKDAADAIYFGCVVTLESEGETKTVRLVGADEIDTAKKYISIDSPLSQALLKKRVDDSVTITVDERVIHYDIVELSYPGFD